MLTPIRGMVCKVCDGPLTGRQTKYCSGKCRQSDENRQYQSYEAQQARGGMRKLAFLRQRGGGCERCGYDRNLAALSFHHRDPEDKVFTLDLRALSNRSMKACATEAAKCDLLCMNCHMEVHYPGRALSLHDLV